MVWLVLYTDLFLALAGASLLTRPALPSKLINPALFAKASVLNLMLFVFAWHGVKRREKKKK
jgi:hypothetical protein